MTRKHRQSGTWPGGYSRHQSCADVDDDKDARPHPHYRQMFADIERTRTFARDAAQHAERALRDFQRGPHSKGRRADDAFHRLRMELSVVYAASGGGEQTVTYDAY